MSNVLISRHPLFKEGEKNILTSSPIPERKNKTKRVSVSESRATFSLHKIPADSFFLGSLIF